MASTEQKAQKAFGIRDSRDMLKKLRWELNNLFCRQRHDIEACQYRAFNCAVTAWHVTDWLWEDIPSELKGKQNWKRCRDFQRYVRDKCPALTLCHQIANGSKHCRLTNGPDPTISASISDGEGYDYGNPIILEHNTCHMADKVFDEALVWLEAFVRDWGIFPEEPFVPSGDGPSTNRDWLRQVRIPR